MTEERKAGEKNSGFFGIDPTGKTPEQIELEWFENHYHGYIPQQFRFMPSFLFFKVDGNIAYILTII